MATASTSRRGSEALAEPGGICISGMVHEQIRDRLPFAVRGSGRAGVKNIARPVRVYALRPEAVAALPKAECWPAPRPTAPRYASRNIAAAAMACVLIVAGGSWWLWPSPRRHHRATLTRRRQRRHRQRRACRSSCCPSPISANDPEQQYFADGITEDLTTDLSRIPNMLVISRNTAFTYRSKPVNAKQIGRDLGVRYVLEGSVRRSGNQVRITAQLIDAETDAHLWAERFDHEVSDLFALQNEITSRIANTLSIELIAAEVGRPTDNPDAVDYILRGRDALAKGRRRRT